MKKTLTILASLLISTTLFAADVARAGETKAERKADCDNIAEVASLIMQNRQNGTDLTKLYNIAQGTPVLENLVKLAYLKPRFSSDEYQKKAVQDFTNDFTIMCYAKKKI